MERSLKQVSSGWTQPDETCLQKGSIANVFRRLDDAIIA
jgi:hypothetical protein